MTTSDWDALRLALSCSPAATVGAVLPSLVAACAASLDGNFALVYWACRSHSLLLPEAPPGGEAVAATWQALQQQAPFLLLLQTAFESDGKLHRYRSRLVS